MLNDDPKLHASSTDTALANRPVPMIDNELDKRMNRRTETEEPNVVTEKTESLDPSRTKLRRLRLDPSSATSSTLSELPNLSSTHIYLLSLSFSRHPQKQREKKKNKMNYSCSVVEVCR